MIDLLLWNKSQVQALGMENEQEKKNPCPNVTCMLVGRMSS